MGKIYDIFNKRKKKEQELAERQLFLDENIDKSNKLQEENSKIQRSVMEIAWKNQQLNEELKELVAKNERTKVILLEQEQRVRTDINDVEERKKEVRKEEIVIEARKAEVRKQESIVAEHDTQVKKREAEAEKLKTESEETTAKYKNFIEELESQKENIQILEEEAGRKSQEADEKEAIANKIFERAKTIDDEIKEKEAKFEKYREEIENSLQEKVAEYDRRIADLESAKELIDDINYDDSEDGKRAKIVVKEAIRQAKKSLTDIKTQFDELDEKYSNGTFKGFATPLSEIDKCFDDLKTQYQQIKEHIEANELPNSVSKWLDSIEDYLNNADKNKKSWEFSESFRNIIFGLAACKNYELLLAILNEWSGSSEERSENNDSFTDWYDILEVEPDATQDDIKKKYREMAKKYHPDKANSENEEEYKKLFILIKKAYEVLKDINKRSEFDEKRKQHKK